MIEVFKTDVSDFLTAQKVVDFLHREFKNYQANFDLDDCDKILRIKSFDEKICPIEIEKLLAGFGLKAEVLPDITAKTTII
jgi:hypothetical protein